MIHTLKGSQLFKGFLIEYSSSGYRLNKYFCENGEYQSEVVMDKIEVYAKSKKELLTSLEEEIRKKFPTEKIYIDPEVFLLLEELEMDDDFDFQDFEFDDGGDYFDGWENDPQ